MRTSTTLALFAFMVFGGCASPDQPNAGHRASAFEPSGAAYELQQLTVQPVARVQTRPAYPFELRRKGISGEAIVEFIVKADGTVANAHAVRATQPAFGDSAVAAVQRWVFRPGKIDGVAVNTRMVVPMVFSLSQNMPPPPPKPEHVVVTGPVYSLRDVSKQPIAISQTKPVYPFALRKGGVSGQAVMEFVVTKEGFVANARIIEATHEEFGQSAAAAVSSWFFKPGTLNGEPVNVRMVVPMVFALDNGG